MSDEKYPETVGQWTGGSNVALAGDLKLVFEGKLVEMGKDPTNVTVTLTNVEGAVCVSLENDSGVFHSDDPAVDAVRRNTHQAARG